MDVGEDLVGRREGEQRRREEEQWGREGEQRRREEEQWGLVSARVMGQLGARSVEGLAG
jgi:hypothetical protein